MSDPHTPDGSNLEHPVYPPAQQYPPQQYPAQQYPVQQVQQHQAPPPLAPGGYPIYQTVPQPSRQSGLAVAALIVGICSLVFCLIPFIGTVIGIAGGITAVVLGGAALKKSQSTGMSLTGIITGGLATLITITVLIFSIWIWSSVTSSINDATTKYSERLDKSLDNLNSTKPTPGPTESSSGGSGSGSGSGTNPGTTTTERTPTFCTAYFNLTQELNNSLKEKGIGGGATEALKQAYRDIAAIPSPNQALYKEMSEITQHPEKATESKVESLGTEIAGKMKEDLTACS